MSREFNIISHKIITTLLILTRLGILEAQICVE